MWACPEGVWSCARKSTNSNNVCHVCLGSTVRTNTDIMKALSSPESPRKRSMRRVPKPLMEKRRRERINHSLETLRLLMLENTCNEKLKNPKVEKAEILESVVQFLKTEKEVLPRDQTRAQQNNYHDGMRSCLLRVSHFIATKSQDLGETGGETAQASAAPPEPRNQTSRGHMHNKALIPAPVGDSAPLTAQHLPRQHRQHRRHGTSHPYLSQRTGLHTCETRKLLSSPAACTHITDLVWRPWPQ